MFVDRGGLRLLNTDVSHEAWQVTLDRMELDVIRAEIALANDGELRIDEWDVPGDHGPIPPALRAQARELLERQQAVLEQVAQKLGATLRQQAVVERVSQSSTSPSGPIYVDVSA